MNINRRKFLRMGSISVVSLISVFAHGIKSRSQQLSLEETITVVSYLSTYLLSFCNATKRNHYRFTVARIWSRNHVCPESPSILGCQTIV